MRGFSCTLHVCMPGDKTDRAGLTEASYRVEMLRRRRFLAST